MRPPFTTPFLRCSFCNAGKDGPMTGALIEHLKQQDSAKVIFVSSVLGLPPRQRRAFASLRIMK